MMGAKEGVFKMSVNEILDMHYKKGVKFDFKLINSKDDDYPHDMNYVVIAGDNKSLHLLGEVLIAMSKEAAGARISFHPNNAGRAFVSEESDCGIYIIKE